MKKQWCAADAAAFLPASVLSALLGAALAGAALLCGPAMADPDPAAGPANPTSTAPAAKRSGGEL